MQNTHTKLTDKQMAILLATLTAIMPLSIDAYLPSLTMLARDLNANVHIIEKSLSSFMFGVAFGQLMGGSISDVTGRRVIALSGLVVYIISSGLLAMAQTADQLIFLRSIQAIGAGMAAVMSGAVVRDFYDGKQAVQMFALIGIIMMSAPLLAPMLGSVLQSLGGWRAIFTFLMVYAMVVWLLLWRFLPHPKQTGKLDKHFFGDTLARYRKILSTKIAMGFLFFQAFSFGSMLIFLTESPFVYMEQYGLNPHQYAILFACNIFAMATFNRITAWRIRRGSNSENILLAGIIIQLLANSCAVFATFAYSGKPPLWLLATCIILSVGTQGLITANTQAGFMKHFRTEGGSANAILMSSSSLIGAIIGWTTTELHNGTVYIMPVLMLCSTLCGVILLFICSHQTWTSKIAGTRSTSLPSLIRIVIHKSRCAWRKQIRRFQQTPIMPSEQHQSIDSRPLTYVVAGVVLNEKGEYLLSSRPKGKAYAGYWEFAGGKVENNESELDALKREFAEELGITIHHATPWLTKIYSYEHAHVHLRFFRVQANQWSGTIQARENQQWSWQKAGDFTVSPMLPANSALLRALSIPSQLTGNLQTGFYGQNNMGDFKVMPSEIIQANEIVSNNILLTAYQAAPPAQSIWRVVHHRAEFEQAKIDADAIIWQISDGIMAQEVLTILQQGVAQPLIILTTTILREQYQQQWLANGAHCVIDAV